MPPIKYGLHSEKLNTGGGQSGLSPTLLSGSIAAGLQAPQVNINAANVRAADIPVPKIIPDNTINEAARFANTLVAETLNYQDRRDKVTADDIVNRYETDERRRWAGQTDANGQFKPGYSAAEGDLANSSYNQTVAESKQTMQEYLQGVSPAARQKALLRMHDTHGAFTARASAHNARQLKFAEGQKRAVEGERINKEMEVDPERAWGQLTVHAGNSSTEQEKVKIMGDGMANAVSKIFDEELTSGATEEQALIKANTFFQAHREELPEDAERLVSSSMRQLAQTVQAKKDDVIAQELAARKERIKTFGSSDVGKMLIGGEVTMPGLATYYSTVMGVFKGDEDKGKKAIITNYQEAFRGLMQSPRGYEGALVAWNNLKKVAEEGEFPIGDIGILGAIEKFMTGGLRTEADTRKLAASNSFKKSSLVGILKAKTEAELAFYMNKAMNNPNLKAEDISFLEGASDAQRSELTMEKTAADKIKTDTNFLVYRKRANDGASPAFEAEVYAAVEEHDITANQAKEILNRADKFSAGAVSPEYKALEKKISKYVKTEGVIYDPSTNSTRMKNMLSDGEIAAIEVEQKAWGRTDEFWEDLATSSLMKEAEMWKHDPQNQGAKYTDFINDFFMQKKEVQQSTVARFIRGAVNAIRDASAFDLEVLPDLPPKEPAVEYQKPSPSGRGIEAIPIKGVSGMTVKEKAAIKAKPSPIGLDAPKRLEEYAISSIPDKFKSSPLYNDKSTDWLLALQMLREYGKPIDLLDHASINKAASDVQNTVEFQEWKTTKQRGL